MSHQEEQKEYLTIANEALMVKVAEQEIIINACIGSNNALVEVINQSSERLRDMTLWSDCIGSDERDEIERIIHLLN